MKGVTLSYTVKKATKLLTKPKSNATKIYRTIITKETLKRCAGTIHNLEIDGKQENDTDNSKAIQICDYKTEENNCRVSSPDDIAAKSTSAYDSQNLRYEGEVAIYTDINDGREYQWDKEKKEWCLRNNIVYGFEDDTHVYTDGDGTKYFWDKEKNAWFPKVDEDFMARYQLNYGFIDSTKVEVTQSQKFDKSLVDEKTKKVKGEKRKASEPTWFEVDETQNTNVYVSHLPLDIEEEEFVDLMQKCGLVMRDPQFGKFKVKLYKEPGTHILKGDGLCSYIRIESVDLALKLLDGYDFKGHKIKVERAKFRMKGEYDPKLKPKMKKKKDKLKLKKQQEKIV
ncbi:hypothetical protein NQ318_009742 [Aromia moschata]|uniref:RRM domain-containing protein n=1 Tax=Aromia moschata TaxID=1265417 RepID=A0AAV8Y405_9CUCU|nr:hypothetical protein NQ318_009742 [Aromia moschata]